MKSRFVKFVVSLFLLAVIVGIYLLVTHYVRRNMVVDGPGMEYSFRDYELNGGDWQELWQEEPITLSFEDDILRVIIDEEEIETAYTIDAEIVYQIGDKVMLVPEMKTLPFQSMIYHKEETDDSEISFLTCFADAEGKKFVTEFVREDLEKLLPEGCYSELANEARNGETVQ